MILLGSCKLFLKTNPLIFWGDFFVWWWWWWGGVQLEPMWMSGPGTTDGFKNAIGFISGLNWYVWSIRRCMQTCRNTLNSNRPQWISLDLPITAHVQSSWTHFLRNVWNIPATFSWMHKMCVSLHCWQNVMTQWVHVCILACVFNSSQQSCSNIVYCSTAHHTSLQINPESALTAIRRLCTRLCWRVTVWWSCVFHCSYINSICTQFLMFNTIVGDHYIYN